MKISVIAQCLEEIAPLNLQEEYDNAGLLVGNAGGECEGILVSLDLTEEVIQEAVVRKCNLVVAHHPIIFKGLQKLNGKNYVERSVISAVKNDIAVYAIHTNLDNILTGVNYTIAQKLNLQNIRPLSPKTGTLKKLVTFCPIANAPAIRQALFAAGAGSIGKYAECSFMVHGSGSFKAGEGAHPYIGEVGILHQEAETRIEVIFPANIEIRVLRALRQCHPYEEIAYDMYQLTNPHPDVGSGLVGDLPTALSEEDLLFALKMNFGLTVIRHTLLLGRKITKVALCGGAGSFLIAAAKASGAGAYITSDVKYHEFFDADNTILLADIGHYESEQFTIDLLADILQQKFPNFAVLKTETNTNPVCYFL